MNFGDYFFARRLTLTDCHAHILDPISFKLAGHDDGCALNAPIY